MSLVNKYFLRIIGAISAKVAWDKLQNEFQGNLKVYSTRHQTLRRKCENLNTKDYETVKDNYYSRVDEVLIQLRIYGDDILEKKVFGKI